MTRKLSIIALALLAAVFATAHAQRSPLGRLILGSPHRAVSGGGGGGGTPFALWPDLYYEDLPSGFTFTEAEQPTTTTTDTATSAAGIEAAAVNGVRITLTTSDATGVATLNGLHDVDIVINEGVALGALLILNSDDMRVRGAGPNSRLSEVYFASSTDCTASSLLMGSQELTQGPAVQTADSARIALVALVAHGVGDGAGMYFGAGSQRDNFLVAGVNFGGEANGGNGDWGVRWDNSANVIIVDSQAEARGLQPVIRRSGHSPNHFYYRTTTVNLYDAEATADVNVTGGMDYREMRQVECKHYVSDLGASAMGLRYGTIDDEDAGNGAVSTQVYYSDDATWYSPADPDASNVDAAWLESLEQSVAAWQFRRGTTTYVETLSGTYAARHPGWTAPTSPTLGVQMGVASPYSL